MPEIFAAEGETAFRARERAAVADAVASPEPLVIACGGGAMVDAENRRAVRDAGVRGVARVRARRARGARRARRHRSRGRCWPAVRPRPRSPGSQGIRAGTYEQAADARVATDGHDVEAVTRAVLAAYRGACEGDIVTTVRVELDPPYDVVVDVGRARPTPARCSPAAGGSRS